MLNMQLIEEVREVTLELSDVHPEYEKELVFLASGEWVFVDDELEFIIETELKS